MMIQPEILQSFHAWNFSWRILHCTTYFPTRPVSTLWAIGTFLYSLERNDVVTRIYSPSNTVGFVIRQMRVRTRDERILHFQKPAWLGQNFGSETGKTDYKNRKIPIAISNERLFW